MNSILFATDGSESSKHAGEMVKDYLKAWPEAELYVLYVTAKENYAYDYIPDVIDRYEDQIKKDIRNTVENQMYTEWKNHVHFVHKVGHPSTTICDVAKEKNADIIIVGSHGRGFFDRSLLGSVAHAVLNRTELPVLVAR
ncbi:universal stress protein UspA [Lentibacillus kapialis]|uniref:Universal stress protein UspA n=1 Tax=Lentibacillus kapialis TaxID=340214 RepID=A0A917UVR0_9BACI|nr:universal stress protein [Lentibacillus kapialis]GGJ88918.1 universal stress protein UspA [Lentibacillus kapialis]